MSASIVITKKRGEPVYDATGQSGQGYRREGEREREKERELSSISVDVMKGCTERLHSELTVADSIWSAGGREGHLTRPNKYRKIALSCGAFTFKVVQSSFLKRNPGLPIMS